MEGVSQVSQQDDDGIDDDSQVSRNKGGLTQGGGLTQSGMGFSTLLQLCYRALQDGDEGGIMDRRILDKGYDKGSDQHKGQGLMTTHPLDPSISSLSSTLDHPPTPASAPTSAPDLASALALDLAPALPLAPGLELALDADATTLHAMVVRAHEAVGGSHTPSLTTRHYSCSHY